MTFGMILLALLCLNLTLCLLIRIRNVVKASENAAASAAARKTRVFLTADGTAQLVQPDCLCYRLVALLTFVGVNTLLPGLHSYG